MAGAAFFPAPGGGHRDKHCQAAADGHNAQHLRMNSGSDEKTPRHRWPWFVLAAVILFFALAIFWMSMAVHQLRQQRNVNAPLPSSAPAR